MSFKSLALALMVVTTPAAAQHSPRELAQLCTNPQPQTVFERGLAKLKRLDRLPRGDSFLAVLRRENGCTRPQRVSDYQANLLQRR